MNSQQKIRLLALFGGIALLLLSGIQYYLVTKAYQYRLEQFQDAVKIAVDDVFDNSVAIDSLIELERDRLGLLGHSYSMGEQFNAILPKEWHQLDSITQAQYHKDLAGAQININEFIWDKTDFEQQLAKQSNTDHLLFKDLINEELKKREFSYELEYAIKLTEFHILSAKDTLYQTKKDYNQHLIGQEFGLKNAIRISTNKSESSISSKTDGKERPKIAYTSTIIGYTSIYANLDQWKKVVFREMYLLLSLAILSILAMSLLFFLSIRAILKQKRIADMKTDFINNVSHELKTPLATLGLATQNLRFFVAQQGKTEQVLDITQTIERQNKQLQKLVDEVLNKSVEADAIELDRKQIEINTFLQHIIKDFKLRQHTQKVSIRTDFEPTISHISGDPFHLSTAINNLLDNAVKYNPEGVVIDIKTNIHNNKFTLMISDNGIGIDLKKYKQQLFDKFFRVPTGNVHNVKGLGLGLYLVKQIVEAHQGKIDIKSSVGAGCNFTITLPIK